MTTLINGVTSRLWNVIVRSQTGKTNEDCANAVQRDQLASRVDSYLSKFDASLNTTWNAEKDATKKAERATKAQEMTNEYYDLATDFYEYGWGQSFHFATRHSNESLVAAIARHEYYLAHRIGIQKGQLVLDVGCGVGGPLRNIARFTQAKVVGLNNNQYQVKRALRCNALEGLTPLTDVVHGDFMNLPFPPNTFDHVYAIEATCHAPDRSACYAQIFKVLKEGGIFGCYEWVMTDAYDKENERHNQIKHGIEIGNSLPTLAHQSELIVDLKKAGFEIVDAFDLALDALNGSIPWYSSFLGGWSPSQIKHTPYGRKFTQTMVDIMETLRVAPSGTSKTHQVLTKTADALAASGETGIFTPMYFFIARKPVSAASTVQ